MLGAEATLLLLPLRIYEVAALCTCEGPVLEWFCVTVFCPGVVRFCNCGGVVRRKSLRSS